MGLSDAGTEGARGPLAPQYLADESTLFQPGMADYPHLLLLVPPMFFTFRHHCFNLIYAGINITFTTKSHSTYSYEM
jgi:hypothetical protein